MSKFISHLNSFFANGLEEYDQAAKDGPTRGVVNPGGAKIWFERSWKQQGNVWIADPLMQVIRNFPSSLYTMSRINMDPETGKPVILEKGGNYSRQHVGLMLYNQFNESDKAAKSNKQEILQKLDYLEGRVLVGSEIIKDAPNIQVLDQLRYRDSFGNWEHLNPEAALFLVIPSGSQQGSQLWGYVQKTRTRGDINMRTSIDADLEGII